mgnify:CR=1 FL=1
MTGTLKTFKITSQNGKILKYLETGKSLTVLQAQHMGFGANLRSRVADLRNAGYLINAKHVTIKGGYISKYNLQTKEVA